MLAGLLPNKDKDDFKEPEDRPEAEFLEKLPLNANEDLLAFENEMENCFIKSKVVSTAMKINTFFLKRSNIYKACWDY